MVNVAPIHGDLHIVAASVWPEDLETFEPEVEAAVQSSTWKPIGD